MAKVALERGLFLLVKFYGIVRTCFYAGLAACASIGVEHNDAVVSLGNRLFRACFRTWRVVTVAANSWDVQIFPSISDNPWAIFPDIDEFDFVVVLLFAGYLTGLASPTELVIYFKSVFVHRSCLRCLLRVYPTK
jgi:hypothetical protein